MVGKPGLGIGGSCYCQKSVWICALMVGLKFDSVMM
jgi:hypothetical protein